MSADLFAPWPEPPLVRDLRAQLADRDNRLAEVARLARKAADRNGRVDPLAGLVPSRVLLKLTEGNQP